MQSTGRTSVSPQRLPTTVSLPRSTPAFDRLDAIRARPALIEQAVRTALVDAMKWRLGGGAPPAESSFAYAAAAAARQERSRSCGVTPQRIDASVPRAAATVAASFFRSPLGRRLMNLPQAQIVALAAASGSADVAIRDTEGHLHLIALTTLARPLEIGARARDVARTTPIAARDRLCAVRIHMYSLITGVRHESSGWNVSRNDVETFEAARTA